MIKKVKLLLHQLGNCNNLPEHIFSAGGEAEFELCLK